MTADPPSLAPALIDEVLAAGALHGEHPVCVHATPYVLSTPSLRRWSRILPRFHRIIRQVRAALLSDIDRDDGLAARIGVHPQAIAWARIDPGFASVAPLARLDAFCSADNPWFVELNAESPAGMGYADALAGVFLRAPEWRGYRAFDAGGAVARTLRAIAREWDQRPTGPTDVRIPSPRPSVVIVDEAGVATAPEFDLLRDRLRREGHSCEVATPPDLTFDGDRLRLGDLAIDVVYRRILVGDIRARPDACRALLDAYTNGRVCMVNSLRTALLHGKGLFALLHDPSFPLVAADRAFIDRHVPWTGLLVGSGGDALREQARRDPGAWALKPLDGHGGAGVFLGWDTPRDAWERAVDGATQHVLQRRIPEEYGSFYDVRTGAWERRLVDLGPFLARGRLAGFLCRVAEGALANVSQGGATQLPVLFPPRV